MAGRLVVAGNRAFGATVTFSTAPSGSFPAGDDRYMDNTLTDWSSASASQLLTKGHHPVEGGNIGWNTGSPVAITLDYGEAREAPYFYVQGYFGTSSIVRPSAIHLERSDNGTTWTTVANKTALTAGGAPGARGWIARFTTAGLSHRYWRVTCTFSATWLFINAIVHGGTIASKMGIHTVSPAASGSYPIIPYSRLFDTGSDWEATNGSHALVGSRNEVTDAAAGMVGVSNVGGTTTHTLDNGSAVAASFLYLLGYAGDSLIEEPTSIIVQYSDNGSSWTTHETRGTLGDQGQPGTHHWVALFNIEGQVHRYWRVQCLHGGEWLHIAAFELWGDMADLAIGRGYTVTPATDANFPNNTIAYRATLPGETTWQSRGGKLVDGQANYPGLFTTGVGWAAPNPTANARLDLGSAQAGDIIAFYGIHGAGTNQRTPTTVTLAYSDNDSTWTTIWADASLTAVGGGVQDRWVATADISALGAHRYWRISLNTPAGFFVLSQIEFWQAIAAVPDAPTDPSATPISLTEIEVEWTDVDDEDGYRVERSDDGISGWTDVSGDLPADTVIFTDTGLDPETEYFYRVIAFNTHGDSDPSSVVSATTFSPVPPLAPTDPSATAMDYQSILVEWTDVVDETGYRVERSDDGVSGWVDVSGPLPMDSISFLDEGLTAETQYFYRIIAFNDEGDSPPSDVVDATTPLAPPPPTPTGITKPWLEVWTRPGAAEYGKKIADLPFLDSSVQVPYSGVGKGMVRVPADYERMDEILVVDKDNPENSAWSTIKVMDDTGWLYEWLPIPRNPVDGSKTDVDVDFAGDGLEMMWGFARVEPWDWDGSVSFASTFPDWIWGGRNLLGDPGFEGPNPSPIIDEVWITDATGGTWFLTDGVNSTTAFDWDETNPEIIESELESAGIYDDCLVAGTGTDDDPFTIEAVEPFEGVSLSINWVGLTPDPGGVGHIRRVQFGSLQAGGGWTKSATVSTGTAHSFGAYDSWRVSDEEVHSGQWALRIDPALVESTAVRYAGAQQVISVRPGGVYQAKIWVYPTSATDTYRFVIRGIDGDFIKASPGGLTSTVLTINTWNLMTIDDINVGNNAAVIFRIANTNPVGSNPATFYIDDGEFNEGMQPTTIGCMLEMLYNDAVLDHAPSRVVWEDENPDLPAGTHAYLTLDFDCENDSNGIPWDRDDVNQTFQPRMSYLQVIDQIVEEGGYDWRVVPNDVETGTYFLQVYNPGDLGSVKQAGIVGGSRDTHRSANFFAPAATNMVAEGEGDFSARASDAGLIAAFGRIEGSLLDQNWTTPASISSAAIEALEENLRGAESLVYTLASPKQRPLDKYRPGDRIFIHDLPIVDEVRRVSQIQLSMSKGQTDQFVVHISDAIPFRFIGGAGVKVARGLVGQAATDNAVAGLLKAFTRVQRAPLPSTRIFGGGGQPTITVAANNASDISKGKADLVCEGVNDDQMIQQAFDMLPSRGGKVVLTEGTFHMGLVGVILPAKDFHLHGMGPDATILISDEAAGFMFVDGITTGQDREQQFSDLTMDGHDEGVSGILTVSTLGSRNTVLLDNIHIHDFTSHGINIPRPLGAWYLRRCNFYSNAGLGAAFSETTVYIESSIFSSNGGGGISVAFSGPGHIIGSTFNNNTGAGIVTGNAISQGIGSFVIANNVISANTGAGIAHQDGTSCLIANNIFSGNGGGSIGLGAGGFGVTTGDFITGNIQVGAGTFVTISVGSSAIQSNNVVNGVLVP